MELEVRLPLCWLGPFPPMGDPITIPEIANICFVPMKSPMPAHFLECLEPKDRWGVSAVVETVRQKIPDLTRRVLFSIEVSSFADTVPASEWQSAGIRHYGCPIPHDYSMAALQAFYVTVSNCVIPGYDSVIMVSCENGFNGAGVASCAYLIAKHNLRMHDVVRLFQEARPPGIFDPRGFNRLAVLAPMEDPIKPPPPPPFLNEPPQKPPPLDLPVEVLPELSSFGGQLVSDEGLIRRLNDLVNRATSTGYVKTDPLNWKPDVQIWGDASAGDVKNHASRCAYEPHGIRMFLIGIAPDTLYIAQNAKRFWRFRSAVRCPLPLICQTVAVVRANGLNLFLTDCLRLGEQTFEKEDLDLRLHKLWFGILRRIAGIGDGVNAHLQFRAVGRATQAVDILDAASNMLSLKGFRCEGVSFIARHSPPGRSIFVPVNPTVKLAAFVNTYSTALLYAIADDGSSLVPFKTWEVGRGLHDIHTRVVRFQFRNSELVPVSLCKYDIPDHISYVRGLMLLMARDFEPARILGRCQEEIRAQAKRQDGKSSQGKHSRHEKREQQ
jgi:hypothetical protein